MTSRFLLAVLVLCRLSGQMRPQPIGPFGGAAAIVEVDPHRRDTVLAATSNAQLFRSTNNGDSWLRLPFPAELRASLHALAIVPTTGVYLVGVADDNHSYSGIYQSSDGGQSWIRLRTLGQKEIWSIAVWPLDPRVIAAGAEDGVFLSRDGGRNWRRISPVSNQALSPVVSLAFDITDSRTVYAGTPHLPWRTMDEGNTWESADAGMPDDSDVFSIHVDETRPLRLFASACSGIYHSINQGASWTKLAEPTDASFRTYQITQDPGRPETLFAGTAHGLVRSTDRGKTWRKLCDYTTRWITFDKALPGRIFVATDDAGILRSDDLGSSLRPVNEGFCNRRVLSFSNSEDAVYVSMAAGPTGTGILRRAVSGKDWETWGPKSQLPGHPLLKTVFLDSKRLYVLTPKNLLHSSDGGRTWKSIFLPSPIPNLTAMLVLSDGERLLVGTEDGVWYTYDGGKIWLAARTPKGRSAIRSMMALGPRAVAATTSSGLLVSPDGTDFRAVAAPEAAHVSGIVATDHDSWLAATAQGLQRSDNRGATWQRVAGPLDGSSVSAICKHPTRRGVLFASRYGTVFGSDDDGRSWRPITPEEGPLQTVFELAVIKSLPGAIFAVTRSQGVYMISAGPAVPASGSSSPNQRTRSTPVSGNFWPPF